MKTATIHMAVEAANFSNLLGVRMPNLLDRWETKAFLERCVEEHGWLREHIKRMNGERLRNWKLRASRINSLNAKHFATSEFTALMKRVRWSMGVYFLYNKNSLDYIGKSTQIGKRLPTSITDKIQYGHSIDSVGFILTPTEHDMNQLEAVLIEKYQPKLNIDYRDAFRYEDYKTTVNPYELERYDIFGDSHPLGHGSAG
jgi:hypothetical protein